MAETNPLTEREAALRRGEMALLRPASRWIQDALTAWADNDYGKVSLAAPLAVELLGKAVLWNASPALLVPLQADAEASLFILVERPDLEAPKLRTIGVGRASDRPLRGFQPRETIKWPGETLAVHRWQARPAHTEMHFSVRPSCGKMTKCSARPRCPT